MKEGTIRQRDNDDGEGNETEVYCRKEREMSARVKERWKVGKEEIKIK